MVTQKKPRRVATPFNVPMPIGMSRVDRDYPRCTQHGYVVRFAHDGATHQKWFGDATYNGAVGAFLAARRWLERRRATVGSPAKWRQYL